MAFDHCSNSWFRRFSAMSWWQLTDTSIKPKSRLLSHIHKCKCIYISVDPVSKCIVRNCSFFHKPTDELTFLKHSIQNITSVCNYFYLIPLLACTLPMKWLLKTTKLKNIKGNLSVSRTFLAVCCLWLWTWSCHTQKWFFFGGFRVGIKNYLISRKLQ